jgi:Restriction endonuclease
MNARDTPRALSPGDVISKILHSNIISDRAVAAFFVTAGGFTKDAVEFAKGHSLKPVDGSELVQMMFHSKPAASDDDSYQRCADNVRRSFIIDCERLDPYCVGTDMK